MKYRIYVDEVGNPDLESSENPNHRFLSLTGVILELGYVQQTLYSEMESLKGKYFRSHPDEPVVFHRKEMMRKKGSFETLRDRIVREQFDAELLAYLASWEYTVVSVCLDKKKHKEQYATWRYDPYHYCLAILLERFIFFLEHENAVGDVMAESRGGKEDMRLKASFRRLRSDGTSYVEPSRFQERLTSKELKVRNKANNVSGLQLADLLAHPSRNEILNENGLLASEIAPFAKKVIEVLRRGWKYYHRHGRVYGKKFL